MTIGGALSELNNLLKADDIPFYYKPSIKAVMDTIALSNSEKSNKWIPVSDRFPQINEWVVCQCRANIYEVLKFTSYGWYHDDAHCYMNGFVIAWMSLPNPYEPQEISYVVEQDLNEYTGNIERIEKKY